MSSPKKILLPDLERKASLRARNTKVKAQEPPKLTPKASRAPAKAPVKAINKTATLDPVTLSSGKITSAGANGVYRSLYPKLNVAASPSGPLEATATTSFPTSSSVPIKRIKVYHGTSSTPTINATGHSATLSLSAASTASIIKYAKDKHPTTFSKPPPRADDTASKNYYKGKGKAPTAVSVIQPKILEIPPPTGTKRSREEFEDLHQTESFVIRGGTTKDYARYTFTAAEFEAIIQLVPHFEKYLATPGSTFINITDFFGSSLKVLIQWVTTDTLMKLDIRKPGRREGLGNYHLVDTYTMANTFGLSALCDEIMDSAMKELWGNDDENCILPEVRDLYTVYSRTKPGNPLRKLYIATFDWFMVSEECNRVNSKSKPTSVELWDLLKDSGHAGVDYINYARSHISDRNVYTHPVDPRQWKTCELHQHTIDQPCPSKAKREAAIA